jgi:hypothetical protein
LDGFTAPLYNVVDYFYAYEEETASAFIEYNFVRPIAMIYGWNGSEYSLICQRFTDRPALRLTLLHSAETLRACGFYDQAAVYYQQLLDDASLEAWPDYVNSVPPLLYPESLDSEKQQRRYASALEKDYLPAFAGYRLVQLALNDQRPGEARNLLQRLQKNYRPGDHGYIYVAMAAALVENYSQTADLELACRAAAEVFDDTRSSQPDPGIDYLDDPVIQYGFYFSGMRRYGSDPDNLFAVSAEIDSVVNIPICLRPTS